LFSQSQLGRGQVVLLTGAVACGKTALLESLGVHVTASQCQFLRASAARTERRLPFGVMTQLFGDARLPDRAAGQASELLRSCPASATPGGSAPAMPENVTVDGQVSPLVLQEISAALLDLARTDALVIAVDDIGHADPQSLRCLLHLVRRLGSARIMMILTDSLWLQPPYPPFRAELLRHSCYTSLALSPLSAQGVTQMLEAHLGPSAVGLASDCFMLTGGNPLLVRAIIGDQVRAGANGGMDAGPGLVTGDNFTQAVVSCLYRDDDAVREVARGLAVLAEHAEPELISQLVGIAPELVARAIRLLDASGLGSAGCLRHSQIRRSVMDDIPAGERSQLHQRAAELLYSDGATPSAIAAHLIDANRGDAPWAVGDAPWAVRVLRDAAERHLALGEPRPASACLRLARCCDADSRDRAVTTAMLVRAQWQVSPLAVVGHLSGLIEAVGDDTGSAQEALAIVPYLLWHGRFDDAAHCLSRIATSHPRPMSGVAHLRTAEVLTSWFTPGRRTAARSPSGDVRAEASVNLELQAVTVLERALRNASGADVGEAEQILQRCELEGAAFGSVAAALAALICAGQADRATMWADVFLCRPSLGRVPAWQAILRAIRAESARRVGDLPVAETQGRTALTSMPPQAWGIAIGIPLATILLTATETGDFEQASRCLAAPVPQAMLATPIGLLYLRARGRYHLATGRCQAALSDFQCCAELMSRCGLQQPVLMPWRLEMARVHICLGQEDEAARLVRENMQLGGLDAATRGLALRLLAATVPPQQRIILLDEAVDVLQDCGDRVELAHALADLGRAASLVGDASLARTVTTRAYQLGHASGARLLCDGLLASRRRGGRAAVRQSPAVDAEGKLSHAEQRVAILAARGHTNREISGELFITVSTVEQHLTRIYRKLAIKSRVDLPAWLTGSGQQSEVPARRPRLKIIEPVAIPPPRINLVRPAAAIASYGGRS
jgi:DNA-binding CsgD family transcriptional regulator